MYKVLIIEDDRAIAHLYRSKLEKEGYTVVTAHDGQAGLQKFHNFNPDIVLLDMFLPKISGLEVLTHIKSSHNTTDCAVIAFSGSPEFLVEAKKAGASGVLSKHKFSPTEIVARVTEMLYSVSPEPQKTVIPKSGNEPNLIKGNVQPESDDESFSTKGRILIVEDDQATMTLVKEIVKREGYIPETAEDGMEGYKILINDKSFAMAIFDINMPKLSGLDLLSLMRKDSRLAHTPVLLMSVERLTHISFESLDTGVIVFVPKPFTQATLRAMFSVCLGDSK